jgi:hypothetical protein
MNALFLQVTRSLAEPMQLALVYLDAAAIEEVPIEVWKDIFDTVGWLPSLASIRDSFGHQDIRDALTKDTPSDGLLQALEVLHTLGSEAGREAILSAIQDQNVANIVLPAGVGEKEFALRLFIAQRTNASLADAFTRAQIQIQEEGNQRRYNEFMGKDARQVQGLVRKKDALRAEVLAFCEKSDLGTHAQVEAFYDDGIYMFNILRSHRTQKPLAVVPGHSARTTIQFRPVHSDVISYDASVGRLRIAVRASSMVEFYRAVLGKTLFEDAAFFGGDPVCTLKVLQERGRDALENHGVYKIGRVWMTECLWERGDRELFQIRSTDCFRSMEELDLPISQGTLLQAKLKCEVVGKSTRPVTVNIRVPSRIEVSQKTHELLIDRLLNAVGIRNAASRTEAGNLWTLWPWRHPIHVWRSLFGADTDKLVRDGVLVPIELASVQHPDYPEAGRVLAAQPISDGDFYGVSQIQEIPSRSLTGTDLDGMELAPEQFRLFLRSMLGITSGGAVWDKGELLDLGVVGVGDQRLYLFYALQRPKAGIGDKIRARAAGTHPVILIPSPYIDDCELATVAIESPLPMRRSLIPQAVYKCGLEGCVPAIHIAPEDARLVVDTRIGKIWVDGVEIAGLQVDSHAFQFIELLAKKSPVSADEVIAKISPGRQDDTTAARQAKAQAKQAIVTAMAAADRKFDEDAFPIAGKKAYRCALPPFVL